jgi:hypothetical protein
MQGFGTQDEAVKALDDGVVSGKFKSCAHLCYILRGSSYEVVRFYYPACKKDSFVSTDPWYQELRCPPDCRLFVDREKAIAAQSQLEVLEQKAENRKRFWRGVGKVLAAPFVYFKSLPALVQSLLIILLIIWFVPKFKSMIIEILKAISGK